ncbi:MAG: hypothetical protein A2133_10875 [Actinobacteria bacterium RBG_16_64_13]|nr:MAG: hypothetical protein A2133_10875 [Actinobacteria bacterium RBG_16_64_13]
MIGVSAAFTVGPVPAVLAAPAPLTVDLDRGLSLVADQATLTISGQVGESLIGTKLVVRVEGPAELAQIHQGTPELPEAAKIVVVLGQSPATGPPVNDADLAAGKLREEVVLPGGTPANAGAYLLVVEVKAAGVVVASGQVWMGKAAPRDTALDLAFVWPLSLGIHRDADGVFYDRVLEQAMSPAGASAGGLEAMLGLSSRFPAWHFTLAVEPMLLTQLRDMADGYVRLDASGNRERATAEDPAALSAAAIVSAFAGSAATGSVEVAVSPYAGADLAMLGAEGWRDGFEQIQMGKRELTQTLGLGAPISSAYSPDLDLTPDSLAYYAQASIDRVVVASGLTSALTESVVDGSVAVRARNVENDRVTLVFADESLSAVVDAPWDPGRFFAALAAELARGPRDAVVVASGAQFELPPEAYLASIGEALGSLGWVRTQTLAELLRSHSPGTRPVMLNKVDKASGGYIEDVLLAALRSAHNAVTDLAAIADATRAPVESAHRLLYAAESRWWGRANTSPQEANVGLQYAERAQALARTELGKLKILGAEPAIIVGREGVVTLSLENAADYPVTAELDLAGDGVTLLGGEQLEVQLQPGATTIEVPVASGKGPHSLSARLVAGTSTIAEVSHSLRFVTLGTVLPGALGGVIVLGIAAYFLVRWRLRKRRPATRA